MHFSAGADFYVMLHQQNILPFQILRMPGIIASKIAHIQPILPRVSGEQGTLTIKWLMPEEPLTGGTMGMCYRPRNSKKDQGGKKT